MSRILIACLIIGFSANICFAQNQSLDNTIEHLENLLKLAKENKVLKKELEKEKERKKEKAEGGARGWTFGSLTNQYTHPVHIVSIVVENSVSQATGWYGYKDDLSIYVPEKGYIDFSAQGFFIAPDNYSEAYWWTKVIVYGKEFWTMKWNGDGIVHLSIQEDGSVSLKSGASNTMIFSGDRVPQERPLSDQKWRYPKKFYKGEPDKIYSRIQEKKTASSDEKFDSLLPFIEAMKKVKNYTSTGNLTTVWNVDKEIKTTGMLNISCQGNHKVRVLTAIREPESLDYWLTAASIPDRVCYRHFYSKSSRNGTAYKMTIPESLSDFEATSIVKFILQGHPKAESYFSQFILIPQNLLSVLQKSHTFTFRQEKEEIVLEGRVKHPEYLKDWGEMGDMMEKSLITLHFSDESKLLKSATFLLNGRDLKSMSFQYQFFRINKKINPSIFKYTLPAGKEFEIEELFD